MRLSRTTTYKSPSAPALFRPTTIYTHDAVNGKSPVQRPRIIAHCLLRLLQDRTWAPPYTRTKLHRQHQTNTLDELNHGTCAAAAAAALTAASALASSPGNGQWVQHPKDRSCASFNFPILGLRIPAANRASR